MAVSKRDVLDACTVSDLRALAGRLDVSLEGATRKDDIVEVLARSHRASFEKLLSAMPLSQLRALCSEHELATSGAKAELVARLLGRDTSRATQKKKNHKPPSKRDMLERLTAGTLRELLDEYGLESESRRDRDIMLDTLSRAHRVRVPELLEKCSKELLSLLCEERGISSTGAKAKLRARLLNEEEGKQEKPRRSEQKVEPEKDMAKSNSSGKKTKKKSAKSSAKAANTNGNGKGATLGFEATLWKAADKLRNNMDAAEYKHVVLGLIFLKYISDAFDEKFVELKAEEASGADPEDPDEYRADNIFWVPKEARWGFLQGKAKQPTIGKLIDDAMVAIERDNPSLKGVLPKDYARPALDKQRLGELIDLIGNIALGDKENRSKDILGRVYEYFLSQFALAEGRNAGQFYTPRSVVQTLVEMLAPYKGRVFDPCCGSGGMFVQSEKFVEAHGGRVGDISVYGQESNPTTWRLAHMNLAIRGIEANLGSQWADSFHNDLHKDLKADYILANPFFNDADWGGDRLREDIRWKYGVPPVGNANFAWVQHFVYHLAPQGTAGFVLANGSMSSQQSGEGEIRKNLVEADLVDCMVALPGQLFYSTQIPVCLWFLTRDKHNGKGMEGRKLRDRRGQTLFIDARKLGTMLDRVHRELTEEDIAKIAATYHDWRGDGDGEYEDVPGFCKGATLEEIRKHNHVLTPGRYVGAAEVEDDGEPIEVKMPKLVARLDEEFKESARLENVIRENLRELGYGG